MKLKVLTAKLSSEEISSIDTIANTKGLTRSKLARLLLQQGIKALDMQKPV